VVFIRREATHAFVDRVRDLELKQHLLMGSGRFLNEALDQALKLKVVEPAAGTPVKLREVTRAPMGTWLPPVEHHKNGQLVCWLCGNAGPFSKYCHAGQSRLRKRVRARIKSGTPVSSPQSLVSP
jgi:hypothetical protein